VSRKDNLDAPAPLRAWTRPDAYLEAMARKRSFRRARGEKQRTQPETPRLLLSTVPFVALLALLAVLSVAIMLLAFPGNQPVARHSQIAQREQGVAAKGWFQEAQREMHR
jgi:hypothetical protein